MLKATRILCGVGEARKRVKRALFNFITVNQDDHAKNFAFLADNNEWQISPYTTLFTVPHHTNSM